MRDKNDLGIYIYIYIRYLDKRVGYLDRKIITSHGLYGESRCMGSHAEQKNAWGTKD
jgi:NAD-dependent SIR2 family protein deacetylase